MMLRFSSKTALSEEQERFAASCNYFQPKRCINVFFNQLHGSRLQMHTCCGSLGLSSQILIHTDTESQDADFTCLRISTNTSACTMQIRDTCNP